MLFCLDSRAEPELLRKSRPHQAWACDKEASKSLLPHPNSLTNGSHSRHPPPLASTSPEPNTIQSFPRCTPITAGSRRSPQPHALIFGLHVVRSLFPGNPCSAFNRLICSDLKHRKGCSVSKPLRRELWTSSAHRFLTGD